MSYPVAPMTIVAINSAMKRIIMKNRKHRSLNSHILNYLATDFLAENTSKTRINSNSPKSMKTISTIENVSNYLQSHIDKAINVIAVTPNTIFNTRIKKNKVGLPAFIFYLIF